MGLKKIFLLIAAAAPWVVTLIMAAFGPSTMMSFAQNAVGIVCFLLIAGWSVGGVLMTRMASPHIALMIVWCIFAPLMMGIPVLAPAILTIVSALK